MNKIVEDLKKQATEDILGVKQVDAALFAELIVQKCISIIETRKELWGDKCDTAKEECKVLIWDIKNQFGVEQ
jgi:hypothetical protein